MPITARMQYYQYEILSHVFKTRDIPVEDIQRRMAHVLPPKYRLLPDPVCIDKATLFEEIVKGGSLMYEKLIHVLKREPRSKYESPAYPCLAARLESHKVPQLYRWVYIFSDDCTVMTQGCSWFTDKEACIAKGKASSCGPYTTFDGPNAPVETLCIEAVSPCNVFKAKYTAGKDKKDKLVEDMCCYRH